MKDTSISKVIIKLPSSVTIPDMFGVMLRLIQPGSQLPHLQTMHQGWSINLDSSDPRAVAENVLLILDRPCLALV